MTMSLKSAVIAAASATQAKGTLPVLSAVAIKSENGQIQFTGSDLEICIRTTIPYSTPDFACCVDARRLVAAINITEQPEFKLTENNLIIKQGKIRFTMPFLSFESHPGIIESNDDGVELDNSVVKMMSEVRYAAGKNDSRFYLNGVHIKAEQGMMTVVASDGHRIATRTQFSPNQFSIIIPNHAVAQIIKCHVENIIVGTMLCCISEGFEMVCTLIGATYPDFSKAKTFTDNSGDFTVDRSDIIKTLAALSILKNSSTNVGVSLGWKEGLLSVSAHDETQSIVENQMPATYTSENELAVGLSYLVDLINAVNDQEITLSFTDNQAHLSSRRENAVDLIMSMRL